MLMLNATINNPARERERIRLALDSERLRCRLRFQEIGASQYWYFETLLDEAQQLCYKLVYKHSDPRINRALLMAENRRERRKQKLWPWCTYKRQEIPPAYHPKEQ